MQGRLCAVLSFSLAPLASAFYLPGVAPRDYLPGEKVELKVNKLSSTKTQLVRRLCMQALPRAGHAGVAAAHRVLVRGSPMSTTCCPSVSPK